MALNAGMLNILMSLMLSVANESFMLSVVMLNVVAPHTLLRSYSHFFVTYARAQKASVFVS
jgi:hypothetical protein